MNSMGTIWKGLCWSLAVVAVAMTAGPAAGQTPEGTVITNTATVNYTDANGNAYAPVSASVSVTVGFAAGIDVVAGAATVTPAVPSTGNTLTFTINNIGNGTDSVSVAEAISVGGVITVTGYQVNGAGPVYATLGALNTALSALTIAQGGSATITVFYDVPAGQGGNSTVYTLTGTSRRDNTESDADSTTISPTEAFGVAVTPDGGQLLQLLPTNAAAPYQFTFTVQNTGNGAEDFTLSATSPGSAAITVVSVNGVAGTTGTITALAAGGTSSVLVEYTIANVAAGTTDTLYLTATSVASPTTTDDGFADVTVIRPALAIVKEAWLDGRGAQIAGNVLPGDFIEYRVEVTNTGTAPAASVVITDALPGEVTFISTEDPGGSWASITESGGTVTATLSGSLAPSGTAFFWIRVQVD
jgi:uncharacterized repeat protein (TIGR01451 family)